MHYIFDDISKEISSFEDFKDYVTNFNIEYKIHEDKIDIKNYWLKEEYWKIYDVRKQKEFVELLDFQVNGNYLKASFGKNKKTKQKSTIKELKNTTKKYHIIQDLEVNEAANKCGDIISILHEGIYNDYGIETKMIRGELYDPKENVEYGHAFLLVEPHQVKDLNEKMIIDGAADQFNDPHPFCCNFENRLVFVKESDDKYKYYKKDWN